MAGLQRVLVQTAGRLRDVNTSQRVALLLGGALVALALIWLVQWAASPALVPLLEQDLAPDELAAVRSGLELLGEHAEVRGNRVYVRPAANRQMLLAQLQQQERLPANTSTAFANLIKEANPWIGEREADRRWTYALQQALEQVLRQFSGVRSASVFLNLSTQKGFTRTPPPSSASVTLVMKHGDEVPRGLAMAAARLVSGAVAGLPPHNVEVLDAGGRVALTWDEEQDAATLLDRKLAREEQRYAAKIRQQIPDPKALVSVQVELNSTASNTLLEEPTTPVSVSDRTTSEKTTRGRAAEQPGVQPNVGLQVSAGGQVETTEKETADSESVVGTKRRSEATPAGEVKLVTAAISLSQTYLAGVFRRLNGGDAQPTEQQLEATFQQERTRLLPQLVQLVRPQAEQNVAISRYYDLAPESAPAAAGAAGNLHEAFDAVKRYGPASGLGLLALLSLGLLLRMSRKSALTESFGLELGLPQDAIEAARTAATDMAAAASRHEAAAAQRAAAAASRPARTQRGVVERSGNTDEVVAAELASPIEQASVTEGMLVAQEVAPGTMQTRKMLEQVAQMVNTDSSSVATLVENWMKRNEQFREET
ncbi:MAG: hypothetical protein AB1716_12260 [Planctomycetota bacterium]